MADTKLKIMLEVVDKASAQFRKANTNMQRGFGKFTSFVKRHWIAISVMITAATVALIKFTKSTIDAANKVQQYNVRLKVMLGSVAEGNKLFDDMRELAARVPKTFDEIMASATDLSAVVTGGSEEIKALMPIIVDLSASTGMGVREVTGQMIRMYSAGAAAADMFRERGTSAALGFQAGVQVSAEETMKIITEQWEDGTGKFVGAAKELAVTFEGQMSMMEDAWFNFRAEIGKLILDSPQLQEALGQITDKLNEMALAIKEWSEAGGFDVWLLETEIRINKLGVAFNIVAAGTYKLGAAIAALAFDFDSMRERWAASEEATDSMTDKLTRILELETQLEQKRAQFAKNEAARKVAAVSDVTDEASKKKKTIQEGSAFFVSNLADTLAIAAGENEKYKDTLKAVRILEVAINTAGGMARAFSDFHYLVAIPIAASIAAFGAAQAAMIASKHQGGMIRAHDGMSLASDEVPIIAQTGEGILSRRGMAALGGAGTLNRLNAGGGGGTNVSIVMENVSFRSEDDVEDVMERLSDLISVKTRSRV